MLPTLKPETIVPKGFHLHHTGGGLTALSKAFTSPDGGGGRRWIVITDGDNSADFTMDDWSVCFFPTDEWYPENSASWESEHGHDLMTVLRMAHRLATADGWVELPEA